MTQRFHLMRRWFISNEHFARFLGVPVPTLFDWLSGRRQPSAACVRLLDVMERLEGSEIHSALVRDALPPPRAPRKPRRSKHGVNVYSNAPVLPVRALSVVPPGKRWTDADWFARSVTPDEEAAGVYPTVVDGSAVFNRMTDEQETAYWDDFNDYLRRTGRVKPG